MLLLHQHHDCVRVEDLCGLHEDEKFNSVMTCPRSLSVSKGVAGAHFNTLNERDSRIIFFIFIKTAQVSEICVSNPNRGGELWKKS
ncbi:hypothetical protein U14_04552 [Candidatus Moduliflexus flocculans]|uniref:Uncharacterized protein n=1 Tax=Candidatus Moduliflexus flocculans TaxID=1499966 RepID=A0A0S6W0R7_9BACT|nr:hypothetical protein U14_04552 [Candidatus Moduliflexus flocculans]